MLKKKTSLPEMKARGNQWILITIKYVYSYIKLRFYKYYKMANMDTNSDPNKLAHIDMEGFMTLITQTS